MTKIVNKRSLDKYIMPFGKYKGEYIADIQSHDPQYLDWLISNQIDIGDLQEAIKVVRND